jgi:putative DNA primase/helicase
MIAHPEANKKDGAPRQESADEKTTEYVFKVLQARAGGQGNSTIESANAQVLADFLSRLHQWLPNGKKHGQEWCVGSLSGEPGDSLKINIRKGVWKDFASGEGGSDPVSLYAALHNLKMLDAAKAMLGTTVAVSAPPLAVVEDEWKPLRIDDCTPMDPMAATAQAVHRYYNKSGEAVGHILRFESNGKKRFIPRVWGYSQADGSELWASKGFPTPRPLYGLMRLVAEPAAQVIIVEGEKCADALQAALPEAVVISWAGGAPGILQTDLLPLQGRTPVAWPDNDDVGKQAMASILGARVLEIPADKPKGWDCADAIAEGWTAERLQEFIGTSPAAVPLVVVASLENPEESLAPPVPKHYTERQDDIILPNGAQSISDTARKIVKLMEAKYYGRGRELLRVKCGVNGLELDPILEKRLCSEVERIGKVVQWATEKNEAGGVIHGSYILVPAIMGAGAAGTLLPAVVEGLPKIRGVVNFPRLRADGTIQAGEYDTESGLLCAKSVEVRTLTSAEGVNVLTEILRDFNPATPADASRMMAAILAPALRFGPWANERFPFPLFQIQADDSQTGKGYLIDTIAAIYGETVEKVTQGDGRGVGGFEEKVHTALAKGKPLVSFDNLRGKIESTFLESFVTAGGPVTLRIVGRTAETDSRAHILYLTDNGITMTTDLMNRVLSVSLKKQSADYKWHKWVDGGVSGDLQAHIAKRRAYYLGAVYAVMRDWITAGMPSAETRHHQRQVVGALNWIVTNVFHWPDVMDGHEAMRERQTSPALAFLLEVAKAAGVGDYSATELLEAATEADVPLPPTIAGRKDADGPKKQLGLSLKPIFKTRSRVSLGGGWSVERLIKPTNYAHGSHEVPVYRLSTE